MASDQQLETALGLADGYYIELISQFYTQDVSCGNPDGSQMLNIAMLSTQLREQIAQGLIDDTLTTALYSQLLVAIEDYSGASLSINPNAQIPGTTIIVTSSGLLPFTITVAGTAIDPEGYFDYTSYGVPSNAIFLNGSINGEGYASMEPNYNLKRIEGFSGEEPDSDVIILNFHYLPA